MKKKYITLLVTALLVSSVTACKPDFSLSDQTPSSIEETDGDDVSKQQDSPSAGENDTASADNTGESADTSESDVPASSDSTDQQLLMDQNGVKVYAVPGDTAQTVMSVRAENTSQQNYIIQFVDVSVNNYVMHPSFSLNVDAGSTSEMNAEFSADDLEECGIQTISRIDTKLLLLDAASFETICTSDPVTILTGEPEIQDYDETGEVIYNENGLKLVSKGIFDDPTFGKCMKIYISNDSDQDIALETTSSIINDVTLDVLFSISVPKGKKAIGTMTVFQEDLDKYLISEITSLETSLKILDPNTFELRQTIDGISLTFDS